MLNKPRGYAVYYFFGKKKRICQFTIVNVFDKINRKKKPYINTNQ